MSVICMIDMRITSKFFYTILFVHCLNVLLV
jgi:hypothetical protein